MRLTKELERAVQLAFFARTHSLWPRDAAELVTLARRAVRVGVARANGKANEQAVQAARDRFDQYANAKGFDVEWGAFAPAILRIDATTGQYSPLPGV